MHPLPLTLPVRLGPDLTLVAYHWPGAEGAPKLVLHHGTGFCALTWSPLVAALDGRFDVWAFDRRGHGRSSKPEGHYGFATYADDVLALYSALDLDGAHVVAHSAGATEVLFAARRAPERFGPLLLVEPITLPPAAIGPRPSPLAQLSLKRRARFESREAWVAAYRDRGPFARWHADALEGFARGGLIDGRDGVVLACPPALEAQMYDDAMDDNAARLVGLKSRPKILMGADTAPYHLVFLQALLGWVPGLEVETIPGATHTLPMERPEVVASYLR